MVVVMVGSMPVTLLGGDTILLCSRFDASVSTAYINKISTENKEERGIPY